MPNNPYRNRGALVDDNDFIGRDEILSDCLALVVGGNVPQNVSIYGDKWLGKTWLLRAIERRLNRRPCESKDYLCIYLDVQGIGTPRTFYGRLNRELAARLSEPSHSVDDAPKTLTELVKRTSSLVRTVVILDGFDSITRNASFPVDFFSFLRSLPMTDESRFAWILSSTRPLREMCHSPAVQGSPFFNIFSDRLLSAFTSSDGFRLIADRSAGAGRPLEAFADQIQQMAGRFPLFLQMACCYAFDQLQENNGAIDVRGVAQKFGEEVRPYVQHLWSRLTHPEQEILQRVANHAPVTDYSVGLLRDLVRRGYLVGPALQSGSFAFDCEAMMDFVRQQRESEPACTSAASRMEGLEPSRRVEGSPAPQRRVRVFISYSHRNRRAFKQVFDYISGLTRDGIEFWFDDRLQAGDIWDERIRAEIARADVALVLASQEYFTSRYCMEVEAAEFMRSRMAGGMVIFPVLLSPCPIDDHEWLFRTHRLPRDGTFAQVASSKVKRDALLMDILKELKAVALSVRSRESAAAI
jgi:TIR domain/AAA domain